MDDVGPDGAYSDEGAAGDAVGGFAFEGEVAGG